MNLSEKILPIEPFNDIWYRNCFYNALIPIVKYYLGRIDSYIISDLGTVYRYENTGEIPSIISEPFEKIELLSYLARLGIKCNMKKNTKQIIDDIKNAIRNSRMVIAFVDCFYETDRIDTYQLNHWPHAILVNGFSEEDFFIVESDFKDSVIYKKKSISCQEMKKCYEGFIDNFSNETKETYYEFICDNENGDWKNLYEKQNSIVQDAIHKILQKRKLMEQSVNNIVLFSNNLLFHDSERYYQNLSITIEKMNELINNLKVNQYLLAKLFEDKNNFLGMFTEAIRLWSGVRGCMVKIFYSKSCNTLLIDGVKKKLDLLYELEKRRIPLVFEVFQENIVT